MSSICFFSVAGEGEAAFFFLQQLEFMARANKSNIFFPLLFRGLPNPELRDSLQCLLSLRGEGMWVSHVWAFTSKIRLELNSLG